METILIFLGVLLVLVIGHELGHFFFAKAFKIPVEEFGVGFPPKIFGKRFSADGTEYTLNWLPFGGFVKIVGENGDERAHPLSFSNRPAYVQALVLAGGPIANIVLAVFLSASALWWGTLAVVNERTQDFLVGEPRVVVGSVLPGSPAEAAGISAGDTILSAHTPEEFSRLIAESSGPVSVTLMQDGETNALTLTPVPGLIPDDPERRAVGVSTALAGVVSYPLHRALGEAILQTWQDVIFVGSALGGLIVSAFTFSADVSELAGPIGIASITGDAAALGAGALLSFAALLSVNLAMVNLLPFPALDGGRLLFLAGETISKRKIPERVAGVLNTAGFCILILLMVLITIQDIARLG